MIALIPIILCIIIALPLCITSMVEAPKLCNERYPNIHHINSGVKADLIKGEKIKAKRELRELGYEVKTRRTGTGTIYVDFKKIPLSLEEEKEIEKVLYNRWVVGVKWNEIVADVKKGGYSINDLAKKYNFICDDVILERFLSIK